MLGQEESMYPVEQAELIPDGKLRVFKESHRPEGLCIPAGHYSLMLLPCIYPT